MLCVIEPYVFDFCVEIIFFYIILLNKRSLFKPSQTNQIKLKCDQFLIILSQNINNFILLNFYKVDKILLTYYKSKQI